MGELEDPTGSEAPDNQPCGYYDLGAAEAQFCNPQHAQDLFNSDQGD
jgi:hypothetical protein